MDINYLHLKAMDTLFFRDGKPFTMGEDSFAGGAFPPSPSVIYGFLRSNFFGEHMGEFRKMLDSGADRTLDLEITSLLLTWNSEDERKHLFPAPLDLRYRHKTTGDGFDIDSNRLALLSKDRSNFNLSHIIVSDEYGKSEDPTGRGFLTEEQFNAYLAGSMPRNCMDLKESVLSESKVGLGLDTATSTAATGRLYALEMKRTASFHNGKEVEIGISVGYRGLTVADRCVNRMGGEGKMVNVSEADAPPISVQQNLAKEKYLCIYLATPAMFEQGAFPHDLFSKLGVEVFAAAIGRAEHVGGWDMVNRRPKPMLKAVPAGSVYYVQPKDGSGFSNDFLKAHGTCISDTVNGQDYAKQGFGLAYIGKTNCK